jgi:hypothetical protein
MATAQTNVRMRMTWWARWTLILATTIAKHTRRRVTVPHKLVQSVYQRGWRTSIGGGPWFPVRLDATGKVL